MYYFKIKEYYLLGDRMNLKKLFISVLIPLGLGTLVGLLTSSFTNYSDFIKPSFAPPGIVFPIVWTILYTLMGISSYIIGESNSYRKRKALSIYRIQLIFNILWSFIFFVFNLKTLAFIWILVLIVMVGLMIKEFLSINKTAGYLQIPYLLWLIFASILNLSIIFLN